MDQDPVHLLALICSPRPAEVLQGGCVVHVHLDAVHLREVVLHGRAPGLVDATGIPVPTIPRVATCAHEGVRQVGHLVVRLQGQPAPVPLGLFPREGALLAEVAPPQHGRGARDAVLVGEHRADAQRVQRPAALGGLHRVPALEDDLALLALSRLQRLGPPLWVQGHRLLPDAHDLAAVVLGGAVRHEYPVVLPVQRDLLALPRGLVPEVLAPGHRHDPAAVLLRDAAEGALPELRPEGPGLAPQHRDAGVLPEVAELLQEAVRLGLVVHVQPRDEVPPAVRPALAEGARDAELHRVVDDADVGALPGEPAQDGEGLVLGAVVHEDDLATARADAHLRVDRGQAVDDE
mmetsp:Transcript_82593/g.219229  ORF Transcript_82593/g.219229 Transcript_82593/m.219229 type:complete len:348 (+) Transcript_82593:462-1505(+)